MPLLINDRCIVQRDADTAGAVVLAVHDPQIPSSDYAHVPPEHVRIALDDGGEAVMPEAPMPTPWHAAPEVSP